MEKIVKWKVLITYVIVSEFIDRQECSVDIVKCIFRIVKLKLHPKHCAASIESSLSEE